MVKSKYSNDFTFGNGIASCKWCDYKREFKAQESTNKLRSHLENHHKERLELLSNLAAEKTKKNADAANQLKRQQDVLKQSLQGNKDAPGCSAAKIPRNEDPSQPKIERALSLFFFPIILS